MTEQPNTLIVVEAKQGRPRRQLSVGERLPNALRDLDEHESAETQRRNSERVALQEQQRDAEQHRATLQTQLDEIETQLATITAKLRDEPSEADTSARRAADRLSALLRIITGYEAPAFQQMIAAYNEYEPARQLWQQSMEGDDTYREAFDLIDYHENNPGAVDALPDPLRIHIERQLDAAAKKLADDGKPIPPDAVVPVHIGASKHPSPTIVVVIPAPPAALTASDPRAQATATIVASLCLAMKQLDSVDAPVIVPCDTRDADGLFCNAIVVAAETTQDPESVGVLMDEHLDQQHHLGAEVTMIHDAELLAALAARAHDHLEARR